MTIISSWNSKMPKFILVLGLWVTLFEHGCFSLLTTKPVNEAPMWFWYNHSINCSSSFGSAAIRWYFIPVDATTNVTIAAGSMVYPAYVQLYKIEQPTPYASNLIFYQPSNRTAGTYVCADKEMVASAESVVIYEFPTSSDFPSSSDFPAPPEFPKRSISNGDIVNMSCIVYYVGNRFIEPIIYVYDIDDVDNPILIHNVSSSTLTKEGTLTTATATFVQTAICPKLKSFRCNIFFGSPKGELPPGSATNAPNHVLERKFLPQNVSCFPTTNDMQIIGAASGETVNPGAILTCHVASVPSAIYFWTDLKYRNSSSGSRLMVWHDGSYQCTAATYFKGQWHMASKIIANLTVEKLDSHEVEPLHGAIAERLELQMTIKTYWQQIINVSANYYYGNKPRSSFYSSLRRREKTLLIAAGNNLSSPSNQLMQLMNRIIKKNLSSVTLNKQFSASTNLDFICLRYKIPTTDSHQMKCFQLDLPAIGFIIVVNLMAFIFFFRCCCWRKARV